MASRVVARPAVERVMAASPPVRVRIRLADIRAQRDTYFHNRAATRDRVDQHRPGGIRHDGHGSGEPETAIRPLVDGGWQEALAAVGDGEHEFSGKEVQR